jgi:hypothetical protein
MSLSGIIKDVKTSISDDWRFGIAYNAALKKKLFIFPGLRFNR